MKRFLKYLVSLALTMATLTLAPACKRPVVDHEQPLRALMKAMENVDAKAFLGVFPAGKAQAMKDVYTEEYIRSLREPKETALGKNLRFSYRILGKEALGDEMIGEMEGGYKNAYGEEVDISQGFRMAVESTITGSKDKEIFTNDFWVVKIGENWYISE